MLMKKKLNNPKIAGTMKKSEGPIVISKKKLVIEKIVSIIVGKMTVNMIYIKAIGLNL